MPENSKNQLDTSVTITECIDPFEDESFKVEVINDLICLVSALNAHPDLCDETEKIYLKQIIASVKNWADYYKTEYIGECH